MWWALGVNCACPPYAPPLPSQVTMGPVHCLNLELNEWQLQGSQEPTFSACQPLWHQGQASMVTGTKAELIAKQSCSAVLPKSNHPTPIFLELSGTGIFRSVPQGYVSTDHKLTQPFVCSPLSALPPAFLSLGTTVQEWVRLTRRRSKVKLTAGDLKPLHTMIDFLSHFLSFLLSSTLTLHILSLSIYTRYHAL